jgi:hypothetical protein
MIRLILVVLLLSAACVRVQPAVPPAPRSTTLHDLVPRTTSEADLVRRLGAAQVRAGEVSLGEGQTAPGTILFPGDDTRRVEILWHDPEARRAPWWVMLEGTRSVWSVPPGVSLGVPLDSLHTLNGGPFDLFGFDWDYQGTVVSWRGGRLAALDAPGSRVVVRLTPYPGDDAAAWPETEEVAGEQVFSSAHPPMRRLNPRVHALMIVYEEPSGEWP